MAIAIILGFVFGILCIGAIALTIWGFCDERKVVGTLGIVAAIGFFFCFMFIPFSYHTVDAGEVAVVKHLGEAKEIRTAGTYFDFWVTEKYDMYDAKVQTLDIDDAAYSKDAQTMDITMTVQYQIEPAKAVDIAKNYGSLDALSSKIRSVSIERAKAVLSSYSAMSIIETRANISPEVEDAIKSAISENYFVTINTAVLTNIDFSDAFESTVEQKMIAEQQQLQAEYEAKKAETEAKAAAEVSRIQAEAALAVTKLNAEAKIAAAEGDAAAQLAIAQAEAEAIKMKSIEVARMLGFEIIETEIKDEDGSVTDIEYTISFEGKTAEEIHLISDYLKYLEYLSAWNGELPNVVTGESATIIIPSA